MNKLRQKRKLPDQAGPSSSLPKLDETAQEWRCAAHFENLEKSFERLKADKVMCDFTIKVEEEEIHAHRVLLVAASKYFEAMLRHDSQEAQTGIARMRDVGPAAVKQCIDFIYTGKVRFTTENPQHLIYAAELMQLTSLTDLYFEFLKQKTSTKNCLKYVILAETYSKRSFANFFKDFSVENFSAIVDSEDFATISLSILNYYLASSTSNPTLSEMKKWEAICKWVNAELDSRRIYFEDLFLAINLDNVPDYFLREKVLPDPLIDDSVVCQKRILEVALTPNRIRGDNFSKEGSYLVTCNVQSRMLQRMDLDTQKFSRIMRIPEEIFSKIVEIVSVKREIFLTSCDGIYKIKQDKIVKVHGHDPFLTYHQCIVRGEVIYIIERRCVLKYHAREDRLIIVAKALDLGTGFFVTASDSHIYAMGGRGTELKAREFDFCTETWQPINSMTEQRCYGAAVWDKSCVRVFGGIIGETFDFGERYSPDSNSWTKCRISSIFQYVMNKCKAFKIGSEIWIVRGRTSDADEVSVSFCQSNDSTFRDVKSATSNVSSAQLACMVYSE